jgi:hypothetical protein
MPYMKVLFLLIFLYLFEFGVVYLFEALVCRIFFMYGNILHCQTIDCVYVASVNADQPDQREHQNGL